jgi:thymidylate synthase
MPFMDNEVYDPPCLQSIWCRITDEGDFLALNTNIRFRSNDAWGAAFMNMFGITMMIQSEILDPLQKEVHKPLRMGRLNWHADSYHIYGKDRATFVEHVIKSDRDFEDSVFNFHDKIIQDIWNETEEKVRKKIETYDKENQGV